MSMKRIDKSPCLIITSTLFGIWQLIFAQENAAASPLDQYKPGLQQSTYVNALTKKFLRITAKISTLFEGEKYLYCKL